MRRTCILFSLLLCCSIGYGQSYNRQVPVTKASPTNTALERPTTENARGGGGAIWSDDFTNPSTWLIEHDSTASNLDWEIGQDLGCGGFVPIDTIQSTTKLNGYAMIDSDEYGGQTGGTEIEDCWFTNVNPIDLSGNSNVILEFETQYYKWTYEECYVVVSTNNTDWPELTPDTDISGMPNVYHVWPGMVQQSYVANPTLKRINISESCGDSSQVWIRFHWTGTWGYAWFIDDVRIVPQPINDVELMSTVISHNGTQEQYARIPESQTGQAFYIESEVYNFGTDDQTNVNWEADFIGSTPFNVSATLPILMSDSTAFITDTSITTTLASGLYTGTFTIESDLDSLTGNEGFDNTSTRQFEVNGDGIYSIDGIGVYNDPIIDVMGTDSYFDAEDGFMMLNYYDVEDTMQVTGVWVGLDTSTAAGGSIIVGMHYPSDIFDDDVYNYIETSDVHDVQQADVDSGFIWVPFDETITLSNEGYFASVEMFSNDGANHIRILDDETYLQPSYSSMIFIPNDQVYDNGNAFAIRLTSCSSNNNTTDTACDSYDWNGSTYSQSGSYSHVSVQGTCETLDLTILESQSDYQYYEICEGDTIEVGSMEYSVEGVYTQNYFAQNGCDSTVTVDLVVYTFPTVNILGNTNISPNTAETYAFVDPGGYTFTWSATNGTILGGQGTTSVDIFWDASGGGQVILNLDGQCSTSDTLIVGTFVGIENHWINDLQIHPNPSTGIFNLELSEPASITIMDSRGRKIMETTGNGRFTLDLSAHSAGAYTLQIRSETGVGTKRLIKN